MSKPHTVEPTQHQVQLEQQIKAKFTKDRSYYEKKQKGKK